MTQFQGMTQQAWINYDNCTSSAVGWEAVTIMNEGCVQAVAVLAPIRLWGIQVSFGMMFSEGAVGASNVLATAAVVRYNDWANWHYPGDGQNYIHLPGRNPFGPAQFVGQRTRPGGGNLIGGGFGGDDQLFAIIPKTYAPREVNINIYVPLPGMKVNAGDGLFLHMDHMGAGPADAETQGTVFFEKL